MDSEIIKTRGTIVDIIKDSYTVEKEVPFYIGKERQLPYEASLLGVLNRYVTWRFFSKSLCLPGKNHSQEFGQGRSIEYRYAPIFEVYPL